MCTSQSEGPTGLSRVTGTACSRGGGVRFVAASSRRGGARGSYVRSNVSEANPSHGAAPLDRFGEGARAQRVEVGLGLDWRATLRPDEKFAGTASSSESSSMNSGKSFEINSKTARRRRICSIFPAPELAFSTGAPNETTRSAAAARATCLMCSRIVCP